MMMNLLLPAAALAIAYAVLGALDFEFSGPVAVLVALAVIFWRIGLNGETIPRLGLSAPKPWWRLPVGVIATMAAVMVTVPLAVPALVAAWGFPPVDLSRLGALEGDAARLAVMLAIGWTTAAFGEEIVFRGYLLPEIEKALGGSGFALVAAVVVQAALFGLSHLAQGPAGVLQTAMVGLVFGVAYVACGRNLWPLILAHGLIDTLSLVALYAGVRPG